MGGRTRSWIESLGEPQTGLLPHKCALTFLTLKRKGSTMDMLSARGVEVDTIEELIAAGLATTIIERVGRRVIEITRVKITEAGRRALFELQYWGPAAGTIDTLDEARVLFRAARGREGSPQRSARSLPFGNRDLLRVGHRRTALLRGSPLSGGPDSDP
jgi:hypothetical protein